MIKVLVVEDSPVVQQFLVHILSTDKDISVIGTAKNGEEAIEAVKHDKPDVVTMDINMPKMNGFEAARRIMEEQPTPIVIVSGSWDTKEVETTFRAMDAGALAAVQRPVGIGHPDHETTSKELIQTVKLMSEVKLVRRWARASQQLSSRSTVLSGKAQIKEVPEEIKLIAIGASTGGPAVLNTILSGLPKKFGAPLMVVQHVSPGFVQGFVEWLNQTSNLPVHVASHGEFPMAGHVYVAPDRFQMGVSVDGEIVLVKDEPEGGLRPSVSYLFKSVAKVFGEKAVGVLLTGMGKDGAKELKLMKEKGAITIAQDRDSSIVHGMPGKAIDLGAATYIFSPENIVQALINLVDKKNYKGISDYDFQK